MLKYNIIIAVGVAACAWLASVTIFSSTKHMNDIYGIQNVKTGKGLRPYNAYWWTGNKIILYDFNDWKCMTWRFLPVGKGKYQLQNLSTRKTFEAAPPSVAGVGLWQQPLTRSVRQLWEFIKQADESYLIRQEGTELYLTISSDQTNSRVVLSSKQNTDAQLWKLVEQHPWK